MKIGKIAAVMALLLTLAACGSAPYMKEADSAEQKATAYSAEAFEEQEPIDICGTYINNDGEVFVAQENGRFELYTVEFGFFAARGSWNLDNDIITVSYNSESDEDFEIPFDSNFSKFNIIQDDYGGIELISDQNKSYVQYSADTNTRTVVEYRDLLRNALKQPEYNGYDKTTNKTVEVSGIKFDIPDNWVDMSSDDEQDTKTFITEINVEDNEPCADIYIYALDESYNLTLADFQDFVKNYKKKRGGDAAVEKPEEISINGNDAVISKTKYIEDEHLKIKTEMMIRDANTGNIVVIDLVQPENLIFAYNDDFKKICYSATSTAKD